MLKPDFSLIRDYTLALARTRRQTGITKFQRGNKTLFYVNAHHVSGIRNKTCQTVKLAITRFNPDTIVIERNLTSESRRRGFLKHIHQQSASGFRQGGEGAYAAWLAVQNKIPFVAAEPSDQFILSEMQKKGFSAVDVVGYYLIRTIPQWQREKTLQSDFEKQATGFLKWMSTTIGLPKDKFVTYPEFQNWFATHNETGRSILEIKNGDLGPIVSGSMTYFQKLAFDMTRIREKRIETVISEALSNNNTVLAIYGDSHLVVSRRVFQKMLGPGVAVRPRQISRLNATHAPIRRFSK